jgi:hypothetical protein
MEGFKIIHNVSVHEARDIEQAAALVAEFYPEPSRARVRVTLTSDRPLTEDETLRLADLAAAVIKAEGAR